MGLCGVRDYVAMGLHSHGKPISICRIQENSALSTLGRQINTAAVWGWGLFSSISQLSPEEILSLSAIDTKNLTCVCWHWQQQCQCHLKCGLTKAQAVQNGLVKKQQRWSASAGNSSGTRGVSIRKSNTKSGKGREGKKPWSAQSEG